MIDGMVAQPLELTVLDGAAAVGLLPAIVRPVQRLVRLRQFLRLDV